jgi:hypothetical protein
VKKLLNYLLLLGFVVLGIVSCQKDNTAIQTETTPLQSNETNSNADSSAASDRSAGSWDVNLTNFKYVYQNYLPTGWSTNGNYITSGNGYVYSCEYPMYVGPYQYFTSSNSNLCGIASYMMGTQLVTHPGWITLPGTNAGKAIRLAESAKRYFLFDPAHGWGDPCWIAQVGEMGKGLTNKKGDLTNWNQCATYSGNGTTMFASTNRSSAKAFFETSISGSKPCVALIKISSSNSCPDANCSTYIRTNGSGAGHMVLVTGLTTNAQGVGTIRFKDPWPNNSQTYSCDYDKFLNSMKSASSSNKYNILKINGGS